MSRQSIEPTPELRDQIRNLAATGASNEDIAAQLAIPEKKLRRLFRKELRSGVALGNQQALNKLQALVEEGENLSALTFRIKSKCGWRDTGVPTLGAAACKPILLIDRDGKDKNQKSGGEKPEDSVTPA